MRYIIGECSECTKRLPLINKTRLLCAICNHKRLNPDKKISPKKAVKKVRKRSKAQERIEERLKLVYSEMARTRERQCTGCGTYRNLSHSHIIPRSKRRDLICDINNITYHCLDTADRKGCHSSWENGNIEEKKTLRDYDKLVAYILSVDPAHYYLRFEQ